MDRSQFEKLALEQLDAVYRMALQLARNSELAQELVQEVYVRALRPGAEDRIEFAARSSEDTIRSWLFTITHHTFLTMLRRDKRRSRAHADLPALSSSDLDPDDTTIPIEPPPAWDPSSMNWDHVDQRLKSAIDRLRPEFRQVLLLWSVYGKKYREIAHLLDVPLGTVMSRLYRARKTLADTLGGPDRIAAEFGTRVHPQFSTEEER